MATPQRTAENFMKSESEHIDTVQRSLDKLLSLSAEEATETEMLRSRMDEQSSLIGVLKQRADELLLRCRALKKINTELEDGVTDCQKELDSERKKAELKEKRFKDLAANNQAIIAFMEDYKTQNEQLKMENKRLQSENSSLFSQKLRDKEVLAQKLMQEMKQLTENYTNKENGYLEKLADCQSTLQEEAAQQKAMTASLLNRLHDTEQQQREAAGMCQDLKLKLESAEEKYISKEINVGKSVTSLTKEKDKLLSLSMERGRVIQEKQEEIQQLERKLKEEKKLRGQAEDRFERDAEAVDADVKVKSLRRALGETTAKYGKLEKDFEAFREHSAGLLTQERELNKKLRHMIG